MRLGCNSLIELGLWAAVMACDFVSFRVVAGFDVQGGNDRSTEQHPSNSLRRQDPQSVGQGAEMVAFTTSGDICNQYVRFPG